MNYIIDKTTASIVLAMLRRWYSWWFLHKAWL